MATLLSGSLLCVSLRNGSERRLSVQVGVTFPQTEIGADPKAIRDYAQAAEDLGYEHLLAYDHVLGADPSNREDWRGYTHKTMFHEPLTLFSYLAAITKRLEFVSGVIVLPQRQTALVAKQAAEVDVLSGGRLRLGVGIGWNAVEYEALGEDFSTRGARIEEQIEVMRLLWTKEVVSYEGKYQPLARAAPNTGVDGCKGGRRAAQDRSRGRWLVPLGTARRQDARGCQALACLR